VDDPRARAAAQLADDPDVEVIDIVAAAIYTNPDHGTNDPGDEFGTLGPPPSFASCGRPPAPHRSPA